MGKRTRSKIRVRLGKHAEARWFERVRRPPGRLASLIEVLLSEQLHVGLPVQHGRAVLPRRADLLDLPGGDMFAFLDQPDERGVWKVVTFTFVGGYKKQGKGA